MSNLFAASTAALTVALHSSHPGDVIRLAPKTFDGAVFNDLKFANGTVTITSADPQHRAVLTNFNVKDSEGLTFKNLDFFASAGSPSSGAFQVQKSQDIAFDHDVFHGTDGEVANAPALGLNLVASARVRVEDSEFRNLVRGLNLWSASDVTIAGNSFHHIRSDGIDGQASGPVKIIGNHFSSFYPSATHDASGRWTGGDHPDAIQFWTFRTPGPSHDLEIRDNVIVRGSDPQAGLFQGVFLTDQTKGQFAFKNVTVAHNLVIGTSANAIAVQGAENATITDNDIYPSQGHTAWVRYSELKGQTVKNNTVHPAVSDDGKAALADRAKHPNPGRLDP